jgi:hypothetical protein
VSRAPATPYRSITSASSTSVVPEIRPAMGARPR